MPSDHPGVKQFDIVIVGGGLIGASLALAMADLPFSIALIDAQSEAQLAGYASKSSSVSDFAARVSALTPGSVEFLKEIGAWEFVLSESCSAYQRMSVWDALGTAQIDFDAADTHHHELGFIVENQNVSAGIYSAMSQQSNLTIFFATKIKSVSFASVKGGRQHSLILDNNETLDCELLIAADGANSKLRSWAGIPTREWDYEQHAIVCTVETERPHGSVARQRFSETGPLAFLPLQDAQGSHRYCSIVWSLVPKQARAMMGLGDEDFRECLTREFEGRLGRVTDVSARHCLPLRQRHAKEYVLPGMALVGDAAHTIHPLAGQGVNLGFKDVIVLKQVLKDAVKVHLRPNNKLLLKRYQRQRQGDNLMMMGVMEGFKRLFSQPDPAVRWLRNTGMGWVNKQAYFKNQIALRAMGLQ